MSTTRNGVEGGTKNAQDLVVAIPPTSKDPDCFSHQSINSCGTFGLIIQTEFVEGTDTCLNNRLQDYNLRNLF